MNKFCWWIVLALISWSSAFSQTTSKDYIVIKSDTIFGFVQAGNFEQTPSAIKFRKAEGEVFSTYTPFEISAFSVLGNLFEAKTVTIDLTSKKLSDIMENANQLVVDSTLFLRVKLKSKQITLYEFVDFHDQIHFFLQKGYNKPDELLKKCSSVGAEMICKNIYWQTLHIYLQDCPSLTDEQIKRVDLKYGELSKLLTRYINCKGEEFYNSNEQAEKSTHRLITSLYVAPGLGTITFRGGGAVGYPTLDDLVRKSAYGFSFQAGMSIDDIRKLNPNIVFGAELGIRYYNAHSDQSYFNYSLASNVHVVYNISPTYIKLSPSLRYIFGNSSVRPYIRAGISGNYAISFSSHYTLEDIATNKVTTHDAIAGDEFYNAELSYFIGIGVTKSNVSFEIRGEQGTGVIQKFIYYSSGTIAGSVFLIYRLSKF